NCSLIIEDLSDICSSYMFRLKGEINRIDQDQPKLLKRYPDVGTGTMVENIGDTIKMLAKNLKVRAPSVGNDTRSAKSALKLLRNLIRGTRTLNTADAAKVLDEIKNATAVAEKVEDCTQGEDICDGTEHILADIALSVQQSLEKALKDNLVTSNANFKTAKEELYTALKTLSSPLSNDDVNGPCAAVETAAVKYKGFSKAVDKIKIPLDMVKIACRDSLALPCVDDGESASRAFKFKNIPSSDAVGDLRDLIKTKQCPDFDDVVANKLTLWRVAIRVDKQSSAIKVAALRNDKTELNDRRDLLSRLSPENPDRNTYIVVQRPLTDHKRRTSGDELQG
ncbi:hypothetical protein BGZ83_003806, partial [Gryganskiella cystojenkinii]